MANNTFGVVFYLKKQKESKDGKIPVYVRITVDGRRSEISLKRSIEERNWNIQRGMAKGSREEITKLNNYLEKFRSGIVDSFQELLLQKKPISAESIKDHFLGNCRTEYTLMKLVDYHETTMKQVLADGTLKNYRTTKTYLKKFIFQIYRSKDRFLSELTYSFLADFEYFLRNHKPKDHHRPLNNNGVMKHIERLRKLVSLAVTLEWIEKDPFNKFKLRFDKVERQCLTKEELARIENKVFTIDRLQLVKDLFVFSCYTGLSYIDVMNLGDDQIVKGIDGLDWLVTRREKTQTSVKIPLLQTANDIINKYREDPKVESGKLLPSMSNQRLNGYLKEIADMCEITKPLTFHIARHTFATTITLSNGVPIESVSKMLGHTKISTTQIYAKVVEDKLGRDMALLRTKLSEEKNITPSEEGVKVLVKSF